jgi:xanthine/CO dehydrogenase XdhC/CoxF family maturation factor
MSSRRIVQTFEGWRRSGDPIVLATVYETLGSTYSKAGHSILIAHGDYQGLVSGGCLEGDLAERARKCATERRAMPVTYDLRDEADELWGLGIGCNGLIRVFLQPMYADEGYEPFAAIARSMLSGSAAAVATVVESQQPDLVCGATVLRSGAATEAFGVSGLWAERLASRCDETLATGRATYVQVASSAAVLSAPIKPIPRLLVLGAGLDAIPLVGSASDLGWIVTVADHRPAYTQRAGFERAHKVHTIDPDALARTLELDAFDAVVVMSHHLATDRAYLAQLVDVRARYVGLLGPPARKQRLLAELGARGTRLRSTLKGPVGLDIGADTPESIALSIVAELQATFAGSL